MNNKSIPADLSPQIYVKAVFDSDAIYIYMMPPISGFVVYALLLLLNDPEPETPLNGRPVATEEES